MARSIAFIYLRSHLNSHSPPIHHTHLDPNPHPLERIESVGLATTLTAFNRVNSIAAVRDSSYTLREQR